MNITCILNICFNGKVTLNHLELFFGELVILYFSTFFKRIKINWVIVKRIKQYVLRRCGILNTVIINFLFTIAELKLFITPK